MPNNGKNAIIKHPKGNSVRKHPVSWKPPIWLSPRWAILVINKLFGHVEMHFGEGDKLTQPIYKGSFRDCVLDNQNCS